MTARCIRCHRVLKDAESIARGYGPVCYAKSCGNKKTTAEKKSAKAASWKPRAGKPARSDGTMSIDEWLEEVTSENPDDEKPLQMEKEPTAKP